MMSEKRTDGTIRPDPADVFLEIAHIISSRSTCPDGARHGAVLVSEDGYILSTGYGSPMRNCDPCPTCYLRDEFERTGVKNWNVCPSVHAEVNALLAAARNGVAIKGSTLYCTKKPCLNCSRQLVNAGVAKVVYFEDGAFKHRGYWTLSV